MQSSTRRKVNQNMNRLADRGFFIERLSTAEYKASSGLEKKDGYLSRVNDYSIRDPSAATLEK
jgi:hypothetical protein